MSTETRAQAVALWRELGECRCGTCDVCTRAATRLDTLLQRHADTRRARDRAEATVRSLATMMGWMNVPPQRTLEDNLRAMKARLALLEGSHAGTDATACEGDEVELRDALQRSGEEPPFTFLMNPDCQIQPHIVKEYEGGKRYTIATPVHSNPSTERTTRYLTLAANAVPRLLARLDAIRSNRDAMAEGGQRLAAAATALKADLIARARFDTDAVPVVAAGAGAWFVFCEALEAIAATVPGWLPSSSEDPTG